ncbi:hypothetical protein OH492_14360 [Vibrio chagasii]|nr:hypothetical protein [Vibrio chagasii]
MTTMMTTMEANWWRRDTGKSNEIIQLVPTLNGSQAYKVYKPQNLTPHRRRVIFVIVKVPMASSLSISNEYLNNSGAKAFKIDSYGSRSGGTLPPIPTPKPKPAETPDSSQSCINDNFTKSDSTAAKAARYWQLKIPGSSIYSRQEVRLLSADKLAMNSGATHSSPLRLRSCHLTTKSEALIVYKIIFRGANLAAEVINTTNLSTKR